MRWFHADDYDYGRGLPGEPREIHGFVLRKPTEIRDALIASGVVGAGDFLPASPVSEAELRLVHDADLVARLHDSAAVATAIELPEAALLPADVLWRAVVAPQLAAAGGTVAALRAAAEGAWAANLSGGFHHARRDLSHGFCLVNDVALAILRLREAGAMRPTLIIDLDLHQGDGNASFFCDDPEVFTLSLHEDGIFPIPKMRSRLDVGLAPETDDSEYLHALDRALERVLDAFAPSLVVYVAGSDPFEDDPLGSLRITREGLLERDRRVARFAAAQGAALVTLPAGGYTSESPSIAAAGFLAIAALEPGR